MNKYLYIKAFILSPFAYIHVVWTLNPRFSVWPFEQPLHIYTLVSDVYCNMIVCRLHVG